MSESLPPEIHGLLEHSAWMRGLARTLVGSGQNAEDLMQDTWVAALERPPQEPGNSRGWLAAVLRNLVRQDSRAAKARLRRERARAAHEPQPSAAEVVARAAAHRTVVDAVLALEEPYRSAILLRFFEGLPPRRISERLGVPVSTVHTRITRGIQLLRSRLRAEFGGDGRDRAWLMAILPLAEARLAVPLLGAAVMKTKTTLLFGTLALTLGFAVAWPILGAGDTSLAPATGDAPGGMEAPVDTPAATGPSTEQHRRVSTRTPAQEASASPPVEPVSMTIEGRLLDTEARPLAGLSVGFAEGLYGSAEPTSRVATGTAGHFRLTTERRDGRVRVAEPGWTTVYAALLRGAPPPGGALVVAARGQALGGRVVDEHGQAVAGATVQVVLPEGFRRRFADVSDSAAAELPFAHTGDGGAFAFDTVPAIPEAAVLTLQPGFEPDRRPLPAGDRGDLRIVLRRPEPVAGRIAGQVIDRHGAVVPGAWVAVGVESTMTDDQGNFVLDTSDQGPLPKERILAIKKGFQPGRYELPEDGQWPAFVVVQLGDEPKVIRGRVVDAEGTPVPDVKVWAADPTAFGRVERGAVVAEGLARGAATQGDLARLLEGGQITNPREIFENTPLAMWPWARTDADGQFALEGLSDRAYRLRVMVEETLLRFDTEPIQAGTDGVELRLPADGCFPRIAGRVVSQGGVPVPGVRIVPMTDTTRVATSTMHAQGRRSTVTDGEGRFELRDMPRTDVYLRLDGDQILPVEYGRGVEGGIESLSGGNVENLRIRVPVRVHVRVQGRAEEADSLSVLDVEGRTLSINVFEGNGRVTVDNLPLVDGRSGVFVVPESATTLVLMRNGEEVRRIDLHLVPGEVNSIDF